MMNNSKLYSPSWWYKNYKWK